MSTDDETTPRPWEHDGLGTIYYSGKAYYQIAIGVSLEDAALIVRAVNREPAFEALWDICDGALSDADDRGADIDKSPWSWISDAVEAIRKDDPEYYDRLSKRKKAFEALLAACKTLVKEIDWTSGGAVREYEQAQAAIALAEKEGGGHGAS